MGTPPQERGVIDQAACHKSAHVPTSQMHRMQSILQDKLKDKEWKGSLGASTCGD